MVLKVLEHVWFPPPEEPAIDNPVLIPGNLYSHVFDWDSMSVVTERGGVVGDDVGLLCLHC